MAEAKNRVLIGVDALIPQNSWKQSSSGPTFAPAVLGYSHLEAITYDQETEAGVFIFLSFDEDEVVRLARDTGLMIAELLSPYVAALEAVPGSEVIGMGFELSPPSGLDDQDWREAGISQLFTRKMESAQWERKELLPMIGHYL